MNIFFNDNSFNHKYSNISNFNKTAFKSAKDISLRYVLENHSKYLPERMRFEIKNLLESGEKELPQLWELHEKIYRPLMKASSLEEVKLRYPELNDVQEMTILENNRSKGKMLTEKEKRAIHGFYSHFWNNNPEFKETYKRCRKEAIEELKQEGLI